MTRVRAWHRRVLSLPGAFLLRTIAVACVAALAWSHLRPFTLEVPGYRLAMEASHGMLRIRLVYAVEPTQLRGEGRVQGSSTLGGVATYERGLLDSPGLRRRYVSVGIGWLPILVLGVFAYFRIQAAPPERRRGFDVQTRATDD